jgi:hypothetical protein
VRAQEQERITPDSLQQSTDDRAAADSNFQDLMRQYRALRRTQDDSGAAEAKLLQNVPGLEIDGLVVDETQTKVGRDFYEIFFSRWQAPESARNYTVKIEEHPIPNLGTRIAVKVNDELVFQAHLQPRYDIIEATAQQAIYYTYNALNSRNFNTFIY